MDIMSVLALLGGLAMFLYGMSVMSNGLEKMAGSKMEQILRSLTSNKFKGVLLGTVVTAIIQSSSAVGVMLVGLVNSGIMQMTQATSVTMGSNIGTTITAWILSLAGIESDNIWVSLLKPSVFSSIIAFIGIVLIMMSKKEKKKDIGTICIGFAVLMYGMTVMSDAVDPLAESAGFQQILTAFSNPVLGIMVGLVFTAIIQSSSASVGILQALALTGTVSYGIAIPIVMGQNIGTCISGLLASIGTNKDAKRVSTVHILIKVIGATVGIILWSIANLIFKFDFINDAVSPAGIAIIHTIYNIFSTVWLFPFTRYIEKLACIIIKDSKKEEDEKRETLLLDDHLLTIPSFAVAKSIDASCVMADTSNKAVNLALSLFDNFNQETYNEVDDMEGELDEYEDKLGSYLVKVSQQNLTEDEANQASKVLHTINDFERIGDHAKNLLAVAQEMHDKKISFSHEAKEELDKLTQALVDILSRTTKAYRENDIELAATVEPLEQVIDILINDIKGRHILRLRSGNCTIELGFILSDLLTNYERISDHCSNIAVAIIEAHIGKFETHEYLNSVKNHPTKEFSKNYEEYMERYSI